MSLTEAQNTALLFLEEAALSLENGSLSILVQLYEAFHDRPLDTTGFESAKEMLDASGLFKLTPHQGTVIVQSKRQPTCDNILIDPNVSHCAFESAPAKFRQNRLRRISKQPAQRTPEDVRPLHQLTQQLKATRVIQAPSKQLSKVEPKGLNPFSNGVIDTSVPLKKTSVQNRLINIKRSLSKEEATPHMQVTIQNPPPIPRRQVRLERTRSKEDPLLSLANATLSVVERLERYCVAKGVEPPEYKFFKVKEGKLFKFQCRLKVEDSSYATYPEGFDSRNEAKVACASRAIDHILSRKAPQEYPLFDGNDSELAHKIYDIVRTYKHGYLLAEVPNLFKNTYNMSIPSHYRSVMTEKFGNLFTVDTPTELPIEIVYPVDGVILPQLSSPSSFADSNDQTLLPPGLTLPWNESTWAILVTCFESTTCVWCNLIGQQQYEALVKLYDEIELAGNMVHPNEIHDKEYYIAIVHQCPHRIRIVREDKAQDKMWCRFIDTGELEALDRDQIYVCEDKFLELPAQAIRLCLEGLTLFGEIEKIDVCLTELNEKVLVAKIHTTEQDFRRNDYISATFYDTSTDVDVNINDQLLVKISETVLKPPKLNERFNCMLITNVSDTGVITGHLENSNYMNLIRDEIEQIITDKNLEDYQGTGADDSELYLVHDKVTSNYVRAKPVGLDVNNLDVITVHLIDYGADVAVNKKDMYRLRPLSKALEAIPPQAIPMRLYGINNNEDQYTISMLRKCLTPNTIGLVKVNNFAIGAKEQLVTIFFRSSAGGIQNLNEAILSQTSPHISASDTYVPELAFAKSAQQLPKVYIPHLKEVFRVKVIISQSPQMFFVQPKSFQEEFEILMATMQKYYEPKNNMLKSTDMLQENSMYAAYRQETKEWCRAKLLTCYSDEHIKVHFSDYACIDVVPLKYLRELPSTFRTLPEQAIQAKLYGVKPNSSVGYSSAAAHLFIKLTKNKEFDAVVMGIDNIPDTFERVVRLDLHSGEGTNAINVREILIMQQLAAPCTDEPQKRTQAY